MNKRLCVVLLGVLFVLSSAAFAQQRPPVSSGAVQKALENYLRLADVRPADPDVQLKSVSRTDKAETVVIGSVDLVDSTNFLDDGTPFRIVAVYAKKPFDQDVFVVCLGSSWNNTCGRLVEGRRASFTSDVLVIEDGDNAGLALFVVKKLST
jgi:hypothetical protein